MQNSSDKTPQHAPQHAPVNGEHAAELIFDTQADATRGLWIYPASYGDLHLARRRARSLAESFPMPFHVDLFGVHGTSPAVQIAGYYAYTEGDPRPYLIPLAHIMKGGGDGQQR